MNRKRNRKARRAHLQWSPAVVEWLANAWLIERLSWTVGEARHVPLEFPHRG